MHVSVVPNIYVRDLQTGVTTLVSINRAGNDGGNNSSTDPVTSGDGRYVAFQSAASDLTAGDTNNTKDVFVRDLQTGTTMLASAKPSGGGSGNGESYNPYISGNGQVVTFVSIATNLAANDTNQGRDIFAYDLRTGVTSLVSVNRGGSGSGNAESARGESSSDSSRYHNLNAISDDGRYTIFESRATDLTAAQDNNSNLSDREDVFVRDLQTGTTTPVSMNLTGDGTGNGTSYSPTISRDGKFVAFVSNSTNLTANKKWQRGDIFVRNLAAGTTALASINLAGVDSGYDSMKPSISDDGRYVTFTSEATDLTTATTKPYNVYVRDMGLGATRLVSYNSAGTADGDSISSDSIISGTGRFVVFISSARDLVNGITRVSNQGDVYVRDLQAQTTTMLSVTPDGTHNSMERSRRPAISADGRVVVFENSDRSLITDEPPSFSAKSNVFAYAVGGQVMFDAYTYSVDEAGDALMVTIFRNGDSGIGALSVSYATANGSATAGRDYTHISGTLDFAEGELRKYLTIPIRDDRIDEADETINLILANLDTAAAPAVLSATVIKVLDNDASPGVSVDDVGVTEGDAGTSAAVFTLTLSAASEREVSVEVAVKAGTAALYADFQPVSGKFVIAPGRTSQIVTVPVVGENVFETDETFTLDISSPVNAVITDGQGTGTIFNNDSRPTVSVTQTSLTEGNSGTRDMVFGLSLSNASYEQVQVRYATADGTAAAGSDYLAASGTVVFNPGTLNAAAAAVVNGDTQTESNETLFVKLAQPLNASIANGLSMGIIYNDDGPVVRFGVRDYPVNEGDGRVTLTVTRSGDPSAFSIGYQTLDSDTFVAGCSDQVNNRSGAYARCDFTTVAGTLDFAAGENSKTITVPIIDDSFVEGNETFWVYLLNQEGAAIGTPSFSTVSVRDNDTATAAPNPIFTNEFFVRQQYLDFLSREPDADGFQAWLGVLAECPDAFAPPHLASRCDRIYVSGEGFFRSQEFQLKGFYVFRFYQLAFGRLPEYSEIVADMSFVAGATPAEVYARKARLAHAFTLRPEFLNLYGELTNAQYVAALLGRYELERVTTPDPDAPDAAAEQVTLAQADLTARLDAKQLTRAQVLRAVADSEEVGAREYERAFVAMQYYGYLRRKPEAAGFAAWLEVLRRGDARTMVNGFLNSTEYKLRFGQP
jgi:hypothetical protein